MSNQKPREIHITTELVYVEKSAYDEAMTMLEEMKSTLAILLMDTQHSEHNCEYGEICPVEDARKMIEKFEAWKAEK